MNWEILTDSKIVENFAWTLLHSVWKIAFVALWLFAALRVFAKSSANVRYAVSLFALVFALALPTVTFVWLSQNSSETKQNIVASDAETAAFDEKIQPQENLSSLKNAKSPKFGNEKFFVSVENLQSGFVQNFSTFLPILVGFWFLGILFSAFRLTGGIWQLHVYKTREISEPNEDWQAKFSDLCERLKIKQTVKLLQSKTVKTPMVIGWLKPVILVPASVFLCMSAGELETIIAHELVHIRRSDYLLNFAQSFVEIIFFYHPALWWISAQIRHERECACDDAVVRTLENSPIVYANALANLEEFRLAAKQTASPVLVAAVNGGKLMKRIQRIIDNKNAKKSNLQNSLWSASLASALILAFTLALFSTTTRLPVNAQVRLSDGKARKMAVGFVSIPPIDRMENPPKDADATMRLLIEKLKAHKVPAIGFVQGAMISDGEKMYPVRAEIVRTWRDAGFEIGIGGYRHIWFYDTPFDEYVANAEKNEGITKKILAEKNLPLRYFSYPFLNNGKTMDDRNRFESWLNSRGLNSVKYTFDNSEWMYSFAYDMARKDDDVNTIKEIRAEYLDYMRKMTAHYEAYSTEMFGRDIAQTLVLTPSRLVCDTADEFFGTLEKRGYRFVPMDEAQADEAYQTKEATIETQSGISWFERWQIAQGKKLRDEPRVSQLVDKIWNEKKPNK